MGPAPEKAGVSASEEGVRGASPTARLEGCIDYRFDHSRARDDGSNAAGGDGLDGRRLPARPEFERIAQVILGCAGNLTTAAQ
jgi:hypothetical protein